MRSCKCSKPTTPGQTKCVDLDGLMFRTTSDTVIDHNDADLLTEAECVTVTFVNRKNGKKMDSRAQGRTRDRTLCPVLRHESQVQRILRMLPSATGATAINATACKGKPGLITNTCVLKILRTTCSFFGGKATFGFDSHEIGNKSIRLGAAMALFINDISTAKTMILGRWCIRPQALEWTNNMSGEMISIDSFFDVNMNHHTTTEDPGTRANRHNTPFNGPVVVIPRLRLNHQTVQRHGKPFQGEAF
jgi:hypothetical protein